jgi:hypothetical protein
LYFVPSFCEGAYGLEDTSLDRFKEFAWLKLVFIPSAARETYQLKAYREESRFHKGEADSHAEPDATGARGGIHVR